MYNVPVHNNIYNTNLVVGEGFLIVHFTNHHCNNFYEGTRSPKNIKRMYIFFYLKGTVS
jgi:hypothetical protein